MIISLGSDVDKHLLLHSKVLRAASTFFDTCMKSCWTKGAEPPEVVNSAAGEKTKFFKYSLVRHDGIASLQVKVICPELNHYDIRTNLRGR